MLSQVTKDLGLFLHEGLYQDPASRLTSWMRSILTRSESTSPTFPSLSTPSGGLSQFNRLSSMKCTLSCYRRVSRVIPISSVLITALSSVWRASRTSLTSLTIVIRTRLVPNLGLADIVFPNLRELSLSLSSDHSITPGDAKRFKEANRSLAKFFTAHKSMLSTLSIVSRHYTPATSLLINVPHLPHLDNLTLHFDFYRDANVAAIIVELLKIHSCQLTSLGLHLTMFHVEANSRWIDSSMEPCDGCLSELPGWNTADLMAIEFPNLAHLSLNITEFTIARTFMSKHMQKLRELNIQRYMNNTKPVLLLDDIRAAGSDGQLEKLDLQVDTFNAQLLQNLSRSLPNLRILSVEFYTLDPSVWPCRDDDPVVLPNNNWKLCSSEGVADGAHNLTINFEFQLSSAPTFWFDSIRYIPSPTVSLTNKSILVDNTDPMVQLDRKWIILDDIATMTATNDSSAMVTFTGSSLMWFGLTSSQCPYNSTTVSWSLDGGDPSPFPLRGHATVGIYNNLFFTTPAVEVGSAETTPLTLDYFIVNNWNATTMSPQPPSSTGASTNASPTNTQSSSFDDRGGASSKAPIGTILGGVLGGLAFVICAGFIFFFFKSHLRKRKDHRPPSSRPTSISQLGLDELNPHGIKEATSRNGEGRAVYGVSQH
ncbi:hypothetical protein NP233_g11497 [Leucocoprinus birnbaumii]|uniref:Uncharacterized protein n=1 Tax=Leucocoprinus birnbaumii TaxID=56174 RepID=A0AAD5VGH3_9AGAR|nr:hypothetical protein NP233_g11497 [Leucocoprinus birnbaumii]